MKRSEGDFTIERNIEGLNLLEMESALGYPRGQLLQGARVLVLLEQPSVGQFVFAGLTLTPNADDSVPIGRRQNFPIPGAWWGERLVKVKPSCADRTKTILGPARRGPSSSGNYAFLWLPRKCVGSARRMSTGVDADSPSCVRQRTTRRLSTLYRPSVPVRDAIAVASTIPLNSRIGSLPNEHDPAGLARREPHTPAQRVP